MTLEKIINLRAHTCRLSMLHLTNLQSYIWETIEIVRYLAKSVGKWRLQEKQERSSLVFKKDVRKPEERWSLVFTRSSRWFELSQLDVKLRQLLYSWVFQLLSYYRSSRLVLCLLNGVSNDVECELSLKVWLCESVKWNHA